MPQGLQIFDENGIPLLDITDRLTRVLGVLDTGTTNGSIIDDNLTTGAFWYYISSTPSGGVQPFWQAIKVSVNYNVLAWEHILSPYGIRLNHRIIYGVF